MFESVSSLTERIKDTLEADFADVAVAWRDHEPGSAQVRASLFQPQGSAASIRAVIWKSDAQRLAFDLSDGLAVRVLGRLTVYAPRGDYQAVVRHLEPEGIGALELAFRQLHARLAAEGLFDPRRKRPLPRYPRRIVDRHQPDRSRCPRPASGDGTPVGRSRDPDRAGPGPGSGSRSRDRRRDRPGQPGHERRPDHRRPGRRIHRGSLGIQRRDRRRAIAGSRLPIVSAVGHEIDVTLADLAADRRALTPSEAGELAVPDSREVAMHLDRLAERIHRISQTRLREAALDSTSLPNGPCSPCGGTSTTAGTSGPPGRLPRGPQPPGRPRPRLHPDLSGRWQDPRPLPATSSPMT